MHLLPMRYFLTVVEKESISKAASELHITQQTLSAHMAALEKELGYCLFQRKPAFMLTYAGEVFLPEILPPFRQLCPDMQIQICEAANEELLSMLLDDEIDVMIGNFAADPFLLCEEQDILGRWGNSF